MSKNKLHEIITESFVNDKIDVDRFLKMSEKVDKISDERAEEIVSEQVEILAVIAASAVYGAAVGFWINKIIKDIVTGKKYCKKMNETIKDPKLRTIKMLTCRIDLMKKTINELKSGRSKCNSTKKPEKCFKQIDKAVSFYEKQIFELKQKLHEAR